MTIDDHLALEQLGGVAVSPDGAWLAVVIARAPAAGGARRGTPFDWDRSDVWLVSRRGRESRNLTQGSADDSGYWNPVWSPDGRRLAMLSTQGGDDVRPYVYDIAKGTLKRLTDRGAEQRAWGDEGIASYDMVWGDSTTLLCPVRAEGTRPAYFGLASLIEERERVWAAARAGRMVTVNVLKSGAETPENGRPQGALLAIDVKSHRTRVLLEGNVRRLLVNPSASHLAVLVETGRIPPQANRRIPYTADMRPWDLWRTRLAIVSLVSDHPPIWLESVVDPQPWDAASVHSWSPDGRSLAVVARMDSSAEHAATVFLARVATGETARVGPKDLEAVATSWTARGALLVYGRLHRAATTIPSTQRLDWWYVDPKSREAPRNLTGGLQEAPRVLLRTARSSIVAGASAGEVWAIDANDGTTRSLTSDFTPEVMSIEWPGGFRLRTRSATEALIRTDDRLIYRLPLQGTGSPVPVRRPATPAVLAEVRFDQELLVYSATLANGTFLWAGDGRTDRFDTLIVVNPHLAEIADAEQMLVKYRGVDGDSLNAALLLPVGYQPGKRYPTIAFVYPGARFTDPLDDHLFATKNHSSPLNLHLLAAHGYAVLLASMPAGDHAAPGDPYLEIPKGVLPAVDRAVELGVADPERLGVMGQSYGGYATYALLTYTNRFRAAVALAGMSDLVSLYGAFFVPRKYYGDAHEELFGPALTESGQARMGGPPWRDLLRYVRNSPLYYVERVQSPVMIMHGDLDYISIEQAEAFFTALYRLGKPAAFVRYWGEGHLLVSPANVRDMWQRIFAWFDGQLSSVPPPSSLTDAKATPSAESAP